MSNTKVTLVKREWGTIYVKSGAKTHLVDGCPYVGDKHRQVATESYPENHIDLCSWCEEKFDEWRKGVERDTKIRCDRCGSKTENSQYCNDCQLHVERMRARR